MSRLGCLLSQGPGAQPPMGRLGLVFLLSQVNFFLSSLGRAQGWPGPAFPGNKSCSETLNLGRDEEEPGWETLLPFPAAPCQLAQPKTRSVERTNTNPPDSSSSSSRRNLPEGTWMGVLLFTGNLVVVFPPTARCSVSPSQPPPPLRGKVSRSPKGMGRTKQVGFSFFSIPRISVRHTETDK